jgi:hypothetical protein
VTGLLGERFREGSAGFYQPAGNWTVTMPREASLEETLMVSDHEAWHSFVTLSTAFGILSTVAAVTGMGERRLVAELVNASRTTHEVLATAFGVWGSGYDPADLATVYPGYDAYYARAMDIAPSWPADQIVKRVAVFAFGQVCMQAPVGRTVLEQRIEDLVFADLPRTFLPDVRFDALATAFEREGWQRIDSVISRWLADNDQSSLSAEVVDELQRQLYDALATSLHEFGYPVLAWQEHLADLRPVIEAARRTYPEAATLPAIDIEASDLPPDIDTRLRTFGEHVETLVDVPAVVVPQEGPPPRVHWWPPAETPHALIVVRPLQRVLSQYGLDTAGRAALTDAAHDGVSTIIRGRAQGGRVALRPVSGPTVLQLDERQVPSVVVCSSSALERSTDGSLSSAAVPGAKWLTLFDTPPDMRLKTWHKDGLNVRWSGSWVLLPRARVYLRVFAPEGETPWIAFTSPGVAGRLSTLAHELWGSDGYEADPHGLLGALESVAVIRVVSEEPWFDFRGAFDYELHI